MRYYVSRIKKWTLNLSGSWSFCSFCWVEALMGTKRLSSSLHWCGPIDEWKCYNRKGLIVNMFTISVDITHWKTLHENSDGDKTTCLAHVLLVTGLRVIRLRGRKSDFLLHVFLISKKYQLAVFHHNTGAISQTSTSRNVSSTQFSLISFQFKMRNFIFLKKRRKMKRWKIYFLQKRKTD